MEKITFLDLPNCFKLSNESIELVVSEDIGPRILFYGFKGKENILAEVPEIVLHTAIGDWKPWGGHRLWAAPEAMPRSYAPDNEPIEVKTNGNHEILLSGNIERDTGLQKEISVSLLPGSAEVTVRHTITNHTLWPVELAPWTLTIMREGGVTILPQEPYKPHDEALLPARPIVVWHFTDLTDARITLGKKYIQLRTDSHKNTPLKIGILNKQGWAAYHRGNTLFIKRFAFNPIGHYPDYESNNEAYTDGSFMELESLGTLASIAPSEKAEHIERWYLFRDVALGNSEEEMERTISALLDQTKPVESN
jgi:hypothetical protein